MIDDRKLANNYNAFRKWKLISESDVPPHIIARRSTNMIMADDCDIESIWLASEGDGEYKYTLRPFPGSVVDDILDGRKNADNESYWFRCKADPV
jgi:hypothetical protein